MSQYNIVANLETLLDAVKVQPEAQFNLSRYHQETACGTLFCTAGLAATMPVFQEQGLSLIKAAGGSFFVEVDGVDIDESGKTNELFGPSAWVRLFSAYGSGRLDRSLNAEDADYNATMTDKQLAILRLQTQIKSLKGEQQ